MLRILYCWFYKIYLLCSMLILLFTLLLRRLIFTSLCIDAVACIVYLFVFVMSFYSLCTVSYTGVWWYTIVIKHCHFTVLACHFGSDMLILYDWVRTTNTYTHAGYCEVVYLIIVRSILMCYALLSVIMHSCYTLLAYCIGQSFTRICRISFIVT